MNRYHRPHPTAGSFRFLPEIPVVPRCRETVTTLFLLLFVLVYSTTASAEPKIQENATVIFLPFEIQVPGQYGYLQDGLASMLASRLTSRAGITALHRDSRTRKLADYLKNRKYQAFGKMLASVKANYLIMGLLSDNEEQNSYELTTYVFADAGKITPRKFSRTISSMDRVMEAVDDLSWDIAAAVFGKQRPKPASTAAAPAEETGMSGFRTEHPERAFREGIYKSSELGLDSGSLFSLVNSRRSRKIPIAVKAMDVGDLDDDGTLEIVLATNTEVILYHYIEDHFQKVGSVPLAHYLRVHALNLADIDGNGRKEIYVSANGDTRPSSWVIAWDGSRAFVLHGDVPFYLRPELIPGHKPILLGQSSGPDEPVGMYVYHMIPGRDGKYAKGEKLNLPDGLHLFDFNRADINGDGTLEIIAIDAKNHLQVLDSSGTLLWKSEDIFGASKNFLGTLSSTASGGYRKIYIPTRIIARDINRDGHADIIIGKNRLTTVKFFNRLRYFEGSSIAALSWNGSALVPLWETRKIPGYTADYQLIMLPGRTEPATMRLFFAEGVSTYPFAFWESESCAIHAYEIRMKSQENKAGSE